MSDLCGSSGSRARPATRSSIATRRTGSRRSATVAPAGPYANQLPRRSRASSSTASGRSRIGAPARSASCWSGSLRRRFRVPAKSTIHAVLDRHGLVKPHGRAAPSRPGHGVVGRRSAQRSLVRRLQGRVQARQRSLLLSADRHRSRLALPAPLRSPRLNPRGSSHRRFERLFRERGLPGAIRSDNGVPFASPNVLFNLSKLSVWWLRLGIAIERIKPGTPSRTAVTSACIRPSKRKRPARRHEQPSAAGPLRRLRRASSTPSGPTRRSA